MTTRRSSGARDGGHAVRAQPGAVGRCSGPPSIVATLLVLVVGCAAPTGRVPGDTTATAGTAIATAGTATPTAGTPDQPAEATPGGTPEEIPGEPALPPPALLDPGSGEPAAGTLGSWTFENRGSDAPSPAAVTLGEVSIAAGASLLVRLATGEQIGAWSAVVAAADDVGGRRPAAVGGRESDEPPLEAVEVRIPERGRWVLAVRLALADGRGEATWYWLLRAG